MVEFFGALAALSSSFLIEAVSLETANLPLDLVTPFLISIVFPILYRKEIDAFAQSEQLFAAFMDHLPAYAWIKNIDGSYVYINERVKALPPFQQDCLGKTDADLWPAELAAEYRGNDLKVIKTGKTVETVESFVTNGEQHCVLVSRFPIYDESGAIIMVGGTSVDLTEHKRAEDRLRQSESQLAEAQRIAHIGSWSWDLDSKTQIWSDELYRIYGLQPGKVAPTYETFLELVHPEDRIRIKEVVERSIRTREPIELYLRITRPDGEERIIRSQGCILFDDQGTPIRKFGTAQDVTEHWRAQEALRETEEKYRSIFENAVEGIFQTTPEGRFVAANPALARMLGFDSPEELMGTRTDIAREHYVEPRSREEFKRSMEENGFILDFELEVYRKDGSKIWVSENVRAVRDHSGTVVYYEGTTQDITGRKRAEEALRESEERYRDLVENSLDLICTHDLDGLVLSANRAAMKLMGYGSESYAGGTNLREILSPEVREQFDDYLKNIRADGVASGLMLVHTRTGEKRIWEYHNTLRTQGVSAPIVRGMARDITERRRANHSLKLFRTLIDRCSDAIEVIDPNTLRFLDCNKSAYQDLGYSREEFLSLSVYDIDTLIDERMAARLIQEMDRSGFVIFESIHRRKDGSTFPVEINLKIVRLERDYRLAVVRDITERRLAEEALRQAEKKYRRIFENASEGIFQSTPVGKLIAANPALALMYGFDSPEEMIRDCNDIWQLYVDSARREEFRNLIERHGVVRGFEYQALQKDGRKIWISLNARAVRDDEGTIKYYEGTAQDITQRKQAEAALRESEARTQLLVKSSNIGLWDWDLLTNEAFLSPEWKHQLGHADHDIINRYEEWESRLHPEDRELTLAAVQDFREGRRADYDVEFRLRHKDGSWRWILTRADLIRDDAGQPVRMMGCHIDITERKRAEQALRQAEQKYRELFENAKDAIYVHDLSGRYTSINRAAEKLSGYSRDEILGKDFNGFVAPEYVEQMRENLCKKLRRAGETTYEVEVITKDGRRVRVEVSSRLIYEEGVPVAVQGTARDIGERKRAEAALRESEERFAKAFHASPAPLSVTLLEDGRLLEVNDAFLRMTGYKRDEIIGRSTLELGLWVDSNQRITMAGLLRERGAVTDLEIVFRKKSGEVRNGLLSVDLIELSGKPCVLGIAQDITERKLAEAALRNYSHLLIEAQEAERQNIARELHDQIGQVLTAIRINLQTIRKSIETGESRSLIDEGMGMVDHALEQVRDLSFELRPSLLDDLGLTAALRWYADRYAQRTGIQTKTSICPESRIRLPRELETACFRIVQEALTNVARHAQAKNVSIDVRTMNGTLSLSIEDDGIGFDLHSQTNGELLSSLGLRGMEERAHGLGGKLQIKSAPQEGTEVRVHFPNGAKRRELT